MDITEEDKKKAAKKAHKKEYYLKNKERIKQRVKLYQSENSESIKCRKKKHYTENAESIKKQKKLYYRENREHAKLWNKNYYIKNKDIVSRRNKRYKLNKLERDPIFKMLENMRRRIQLSLKSQSTKKSNKTIELLGASREVVWNHLESLFKEGMTRNNNNVKGWHIDHIRPCSSFDLSDPEEQKKCFHYTNLQPLWWWENLKKSNKMV